MRQPLQQFAERFTRNSGELEEFLKGLVEEFHVPVGMIRSILDAIDNEANQVGEAFDTNGNLLGGFRGHMRGDGPGEDRLSVLLKPHLRKHLRGEKASDR